MEKRCPTASEAFAPKTNLLSAAAYRLNSSEVHGTNLKCWRLSVHTKRPLATSCTADLLGFTIAIKFPFSTCFRYMEKPKMKGASYDW